MILYHHAPITVRAAILRHGLLRAYDRTIEDPEVSGGVFLTNRATPADGIDVWTVDVTGLPVEDDWSDGNVNHPGEKWYWIGQDIGSERVRIGG